MEAIMFPGGWEMFIILVIVLIIFGAGKLPRVAGDIAKGIKSFKTGMKDEEAGDDKKSLEDETAARSNVKEDETSAKSSVKEDETAAKSSVEEDEPAKN